MTSCVYVLASTCADVTGSDAGCHAAVRVGACVFFVADHTSVQAYTDRVTVRMVIGIGNERQMSRGAR